MKGAHLDRAIIQEANMKSADLDDASLEEADLRQTNLEDVFLVRVKAAGAGRHTTLEARAAGGRFTERGQPLFRIGRR